MREELEIELQNRFAWLRRPDLSSRRTRTYEPVQGYSTYENYGTEISDGWFQLVVDMFIEIEALYKKENVEPDYKLSQIKSKFGKLKCYGGRSGNEPGIHAIDFLGSGSIRFYPEEIDELTKDINDVIRKYEALSASVCELCGATNAKLCKEPPVFRWVSTLCPDCRDARISLYNKKMDERAQKMKEDYTE